MNSMVDLSSSFSGTVYQRVYSMEYGDIIIIITVITTIIITTVSHYYYHYNHKLWGYYNHYITIIYQTVPIITTII